MDMFAVNHLCLFYSQQYGMIFDIKYDACFMILKGEIKYKSVVRKFTLNCVVLSDESIVQCLHTYIYDVLAESESEVFNNESKQV